MNSKKQSNKQSNKQFGEIIAEICFNQGIKDIPVVMNIEQYTVFIQKYEQLMKENS